jgi:hypothetical protein
MLLNEQACNVLLSTCTTCYCCRTAEGLPLQHPTLLPLLLPMLLRPLGAEGLMRPCCCFNGCIGPCPRCCRCAAAAAGGRQRPTPVLRPTLLLSLTPSLPLLLLALNAAAAPSDAEGLCLMQHLALQLL